MIVSEDKINWSKMKEYEEFRKNDFIDEKRREK